MALFFHPPYLLRAGGYSKSHQASQKNWHAEKERFRWVRQEEVGFLQDGAQGQGDSMTKRASKLGVIRSINELGMKILCHIHPESGDETYFCNALPKLESDK